MAKVYANQKIKKYVNALIEGVSGVMTTDKWKRYLTVQARFHRYSPNNIMLILAQRPSATRVASKTTWESLGRHIKYSERGKGIKIFAPIKRKEIDQQTGAEIEVLIGFRIVTVYDVSQTYGRPLPSLTQRIEGDNPDADELFRILCGVVTIPVVEADIEGESDGYYSSVDDQIVLRKGLPSAHRVKTLLHTYVRSQLHKKELDALTREQTEAIAEGVAYVVCQHFGIDTSEYSFGYVAQWAGQPELVKAVAGQISMISSEIISQAIEVLLGGREGTSVEDFDGADAVEAGAAL